MFQLPLFKKRQTKEEEVVGEPKLKRGRKKKEPEKPWGFQERLIVAGALAATMLLGAYFWLRGNGWKLPEINIQAPSFEEKIILE